MKLEKMVISGCRFSLCLLLLLVVMCTGLRYIPPRSEPIVRVGIFQDADSFVFEADGRFDIFASKPEQTFSTDQKGPWMVSVHHWQPAKTVYRILLYESEEREKAEQSAAEWRHKGEQVEMMIRGDQLRAGSRTIVDHRTYTVVLSKSFTQKKDAEAHAQEAFPKLPMRIISEIVVPARGQIALMAPDKKTRIMDNGIRLAGAVFKLEKVEVGKGFHWQRSESRSYGGELEISLSPEGKLTVINVLPMEQYLIGVLAGEMPTSFPLEALKAQAIVSRTVFLYHFGRNHREDDFDVCDDVHCQAFRGLVKNSEAAEKAVYTTRGLVLIYKGDLCNASYAAVCGGHSENAVDVWEGSGTPYLRGRFDTIKPLSGFDLRDEAKVRLWIESEPNVCCNLHLSSNAEFAAYAKKYFRWQQSYNREELEKIILEKTGQRFGRLLDIKAISRGVSGRIKELQIVGSERTFSIKKELNIRRALSPTALYSSCFVVDKSDFVGGWPERFTFKGAGWGHGVGMCQIGAAIRAQQGKTVNEIISAYYTDVEINQIY